MLGYFLYLRIAFKVGSLTFSVILGNVKILYNITKEIVKNLSCFFFSFHNLTILTQTSLALNFSNSGDFTFSKKVCHQKLFLHLSFHSKLS